jgi:hypothetical protein
MKKIINYDILSAPSIVDLKEIVRLYLADGWQPQGGLGITHTGGQVYYIQVMVSKQG